MLPTTIDVIRAGLKTDPTVSPADRVRLLGILQQGPSAPKREGATAAVSRLVRRKEAALRLGVSLRTVDKLAKEGALPKRILPGRKRAAGFSEADLAGLIGGMAQ